MIYVTCRAFVHVRDGTHMRFVPCEVCPLRIIPHFRQFTTAELNFVRALKSGQVDVPAGATIIEPGVSQGRLYTLFAGWAFRYRTLPTAQRQIVEILLPGSIIGLQQLMLGTSNSGVQSITPATLCILSGRSLSQLFRQHSDLSEAMVTTLMEEQRREDLRLSILSRPGGAARLAYFLLELFDRLERLNMTEDDWCYFPLRRRHLAELLGLSETHLSRSMSELRKGGFASVSANALRIVNRAQMAALADYAAVPNDAPHLLL